MRTLPLPLALLLGLLVAPEAPMGGTALAADPASSSTASSTIPDRLSDLEPGDTFEMGGMRFVMLPPLDCSDQAGLDLLACRLSEPGMPTADALVAAGAEALPALARVLGSGDVRAPKRQAALVLARIGPPAVPVLVDAVAGGGDGEVREALQSLGDPALTAIVARLGTERDRRAQGNLMRALAGFGRAALPELRARLQAGGSAAFSAVLAAGWLPADALAELEPDLLTHYHATTSSLDKGEVLRAFADIGSPGAVRVLTGAIWARPTRRPPCLP